MKADKFIFPVDFVVIDLNDRVEVPLILGRPFLAILQALIDVKDRRMVQRVGKEKVTFKLHLGMRHSMDFDDSCYFVDNIDDCVADFVQDSLLEDKLEDILEDI